VEFSPRNPRHWPANVDVFTLLAPRPAPQRPLALLAFPPPRQIGPAQPVDATPSDINLFFKGGVYDVRETGKAFLDAEDRDVEPLEGWTVVASDGVLRAKASNGADGFKNKFGAWHLLGSVSASGSQPSSYSRSGPLSVLRIGNGAIATYEDSDRSIAGDGAFAVATLPALPRGCFDE
jgi:hypothetical protein